MLPEQQNRKAIEFKTETGSRKFSNASDFTSWVNQQRELFGFLNRLQNRNSENHLHELIFNEWQILINVVTHHLAPEGISPEQYNTQVEHLVREIEQRISDRKVFTEDAAFSNFVQELKVADPQDAAFALAYFMSYDLTNWNMKVARAVQKAIDWERGQYGRVNHENEVVESFKSRWVNTFNEMTEIANDSQVEFDKLIRKSEAMVASVETQFSEALKEYNNTLASSLDKASEELQNITRTYDDKLALHASVRYWGLQEKFHKQMLIGYGIGTVVVAALVIVGFWLYAEHFLNAEYTKIQVSKLVTAVVITTFGIWAVKTCANLFMAHTHLRTDAQERRTMIHTYLSLLRKGQGPKEEDRQLILQTLFRPSTTGMIKEDAGPSGLVDLVNRISPGKN